MRKNLTTREIWEQAGIAGLALGAFLAAAMFADHLLMISGFSNNAASYVVLITRIAGYIMLMGFYTRRFVHNNTGLIRSEIFKFGRAAAILAALVFASISFLDASYLFSDIYRQQYEISFQIMEPTMDENQRNSKAWIFSHIPQLTFFSQFIVATILGCALAFIQSRRYPQTPPDNKI